MSRSRTRFSANFGGYAGPSSGRVGLSVVVPGTRWPGCKFALIPADGHWMIRYLIRERPSFTRFLDLELEGPVPDAITIWLFREAARSAR